MTRRTVGNPQALVLSLVSLLIGGYGCYLLSRLVLPEWLAPGGHYQFLTNIGLMVSMVCFTLNVAAHASGSDSLFKCKNQLHVFALTLESVVAGVYWPLRLFLLPLISERGIIPPLGLDLAIHLMPITSLALDFWLYMPAWTMTDKVAFRLCVGFALGYWYWLEHVLQLERFPYPFLNVPAFPRLLTYGAVTAFAYGNYRLQKLLFKRFVSSPKRA